MANLDEIAAEPNHGRVPAAKLIKPKFAMNTKIAKLFVIH